MTTLTLIGEPFPDWEAAVQRAAIEDLTQALADQAPRACGVRLLFARGQDEPEFTSPNIQVAQLPMAASMLPVVWQTSPTARPLDGEFVHSLTPMIPLRGRSSDDGSQSSVTVTHTLAWEAPQVLGSGPSRLYRAFTRRAIRHADVVITPSYAVASVLQRRYGADLPVQVLPLATPSPLLEPGDAPARRGHHTLPPRYVVTTATPTEIGRLDWVYRAMENDPAVPTLVIIAGVDPTSTREGSKRGRAESPAASTRGPAEQSPVSLASDVTGERNPVAPRKVRKSRPLTADARETDASGADASRATEAAGAPEATGTPDAPVSESAPATPPAQAPAPATPQVKYAPPATPPPVSAAPASAAPASGAPAPEAPAPATESSAAPKPALGQTQYAPPPFVAPKPSKPAKAQKPPKAQKAPKPPKPVKAPKPTRVAGPAKPEQPVDMSAVTHVEASIPEALRDRVIVVQPRDLEDVGAIIAGAECMLQPQQLTGSGYLLHAALSAHVPVVHAECAAARELVLDAGVGTESAEEFSDVVRRIAIDPDYRSALVVQASDRARAFGWRATAWQLWELHANL